MLYQKERPGDYSDSKSVYYQCAEEVIYQYLYEYALQTHNLLNYANQTLLVGASSLQLSLE